MKNNKKEKLKGWDKPLKKLLLTLLLALAYVGGGKLGLLSVMEASGGGYVTLVWPPTGIAFAAILAFGYWAWPGLALGALCVNLLSGGPIGFTLATAIGNPLPALIAYFMLQQLTDPVLNLGRIRNVAWFVTVPCFLTTAVSATIGSIGLAAAGIVPFETLGPVWLLWWIGDSMGVLLVAPLLLTVKGWRATKWTAECGLELTLLFALLFIFSSATLTDFFGSIHEFKLGVDQYYYYLLFPFAVWGGTRFGPKGAATTTFMIAALAIFGAVNGHGPFLLETTGETFLHMHAFLLAVSFVSLFLAAISEERQQITQALQKSESRFRNFFEFANDSVLVIEPQTRQILDCNVNAATRLGYSRNELRQMNLDAVDAPMTESKHADILNDLKTARRSFFEHWHRKKDGSLFPVEVSAQIIDQDGQSVVHCIVRDISNRWDSEEKLRKLSLAVEQSPNMIFITDLSGTIEYVNNRFVELTGFSRQEAIGANPRILKSGKTPLNIYEEFWQTIAEGREWQDEIQDQRKDGSKYWALMTVTPVKNAEGRVTHFLAVHEDITSRKEAELQMQQAREQAESASKAKSELLANMSHELRTPLNAIIGFSDTLRSEILGPLANDKQKEYVQDILESGQHLLELINDILDMSAIEAGKVELSNEQLNLTEVIEGSIRLVGPRAKAGNISIDFDRTAAIPALLADERRTKQILLNLLSNAVKFSEPGKTVTVQTALTAEGILEISVADEGIGMAPEEIEKAMAEFGQTDSGLNRKHEGTGLGLPLTLKLLELHGGTLRLESEKGVGTTATAVFPADRLVDNAAEDAKVAE